MREYIATVTPRSGGTQTVCVRAWSIEEAIAKLTRLGYRDIRNVT